MKNAFLLLFLLFTMFSHAQVVIEPNPSYTNSSEKPLLDEWLDVEALDGRTEPEIPNPSQKICFDKRMLVKARTPQGVGYTCIYVNTKIGLVGYTPFSKTRIGFGLDVGDPRFIFNIIGLKGTHFNYYNSQSRGVLKHHLLTNNTHRQGLVFSAVSSTENIYKKNESKQFFGKVQAWEYKADGRTESWWIFGKTLPEKLVMQPKKYLGLYGVGYQFAEEGLFIILQLSGSGTYNYDGEILELEDVPTCFNSTLFRIVEENEMEATVDQLERSEEKLDQQIERNSSSNDPCKSYKDKVLKQNKKLTDIAKKQTKSMQQGQQAQAVQQQVERDVEMAQLTVDGIDEDICKKDEQLARAKSPSTQQRLQLERSCLGLRRSYEQEILTRFRSLSAQYPGQHAKIMKGMIQVRQEIKRKPCP